MNSASENCYHCGSATGEAAPYQSVLAGQTRSFCCAGCQAIAQTIHDQGLDAFYAHRSGLGDKPIEAQTDSTMPERLRVFDDPALVARFTRELGDDVREVTLHLDKIRCAACVWLNEQHLRRLPGVVEVDAHYVTQRARIRYQASRCRLSDLLQATERIGYQAWPYEPSAARERAVRERRSLLMRLGVAMLGMMQVMMYAWPAYSGGADLLQEHAALLDWASFALTLPVMFYAAAPFFTSAWASLRHFPTSRMLGMDVPVALALALGFGAGTVNFLSGSGPTYFDSITMFVALLLAARYFELRARHDAHSGAEALARQLPATCERLPDFPASRQADIIPVVKARVGEVLRVPPGETFPVDGEVVEGNSAVDEALLSGESRPVAKAVGDTVLAGSFNLQSPLLIKVRALGEATRLSGIARLLDQALHDKPRFAGLTERWAGYFVVALLLLSLTTGLGLSLMGTQDAWVRAVAVLVVSCPCALSLATPAALAAAQGALTRLGLLVVRGHALETVSGATDLVLDKTGTLTTGQMTLVGVTPMRADLTQTHALALAAGLEQGHNHPIARALVATAHNRNITPHRFATTPSGVVGQGVAVGALKLGSARWVGHSQPARAPDCTSVFLADEAGLMARFDLQDAPRPGIETLLAYAKHAGLRVHLLSGDHTDSVRSWAHRFGIEHWVAECTPEQKQARIRALQAAGGRVWAVGDGINDAPQLAQANISVAVGSGAPLAQAGADVLMTTEGLDTLAQLGHHARRTRRIIRQNLAWAFAYNVLAIPAAAAGWITPWGAAIGMSLSSLLVTLNAWRLRRVSPIAQVPAAR